MQLCQQKRTDNLNLKNIYMHVDCVDDNSQSVSPKVPKSQFDTLECTLEELASTMNEMKSETARVC